eukprot:scaffold45916_cov22-Cyclotella_meneghiniana.AAC.1
MADHRLAWQLRWSEAKASAIPVHLCPFHFNLVTILKPSKQGAPAWVAGGCGAPAPASDGVLWPIHVHRLHCEERILTAQTMSKAREPGSPCLHSTHIISSAWRHHPRRPDVLSAGFVHTNSASAAAQFNHCYPSLWIVTLSLTFQLRQKLSKPPTTPSLFVTISSCCKVQCKLT